MPETQEQREAPEPEPIDEVRHAELVKKHVYGNPERRSEGGKAPWFRYTSAASIGIEIAVAVVGATLLAHWIELRFTHWAPWTTLIGFAVGIGAAIKAMVRTAQQFQREVAVRDKEREQEQLERDRQADLEGVTAPPLSDLVDALDDDKDQAST